MKRLICCLAILLSVIYSYAQRVYFIYLQSDPEQAFYVRVKDNVYSSTASGYLILSKLRDSSYSFTVGFPQNKWPEQQFKVNVAAKDHGYILRNFGEKGWGLYDLQTSSVQMGIGEMANAGKEENKDISAFTDVLSKAANDPTLRDKPTRKEEPKVEIQQAVVKTEEPKTIKKEDAPPINAVATTTEKVTAPKIEKKDETEGPKEIVQNKKVDTSAANQGLAIKNDAAIPGEKENRNTEGKRFEPIVEKTVAENKSEAPKTETVKADPPKIDPPGNEIVKADPPRADPPKTDTGASVIKTDLPKADVRKVEVVAEPVPSEYRASVVKRKSESSTSEGFGLTFVDEYPDGKKDTIRILIPNPKSKVVLKEDEKRQAKEEKKFLDAGLEENYNEMNGYLTSGSESKDLVRFHYQNREDMFDAVSYNKGGRILHMLRHFLGDSAFFKGLNLYLTTNKFKSAEAHQLRLAFEEVSGRDLNWYFNQWYFGSGHPVTDISYVYDDAAKTVKVVIKQLQPGGKIFKLPIDIDIYEGDKKTRTTVWANNAIDTFTFKYTQKPSLVNVDGDKILLWSKTDNKTLDNYIYQYKYAGNYLDRREAVDYAATKQDDPKAVELLKTALSDKYFEIKNHTLNKVDMRNDLVKKTLESTLVNLAKTDKESTVRGNALGALIAYMKPEYASLFKANVNDSSYVVSGNSLIGLYTLDPSNAVTFAKDLYKKPSKGVLKDAIQNILIQAGDETVGSEMIEEFASLPIGGPKFQMLETVATFLQSSDKADLVKKGVTELVKLRDGVPEGFRGQTDPALNGALKAILNAKMNAVKEKPDPAMQAVIDFIKTSLPEAEKKGF